MENKLSTQDKWRFLGALYKHGCNETYLKYELKDWSEEKICKAIKSYTTRALRKLNLENEKNSGKIDLWYDLITNCHEIEGTSSGSSALDTSDGNPVWGDYSFLLSKSFLYAASFEEHYQSENPDEPNYNEIYRYLSQLLAGEEPSQLRPGNARKVLDMMAKLKGLMDDKESTQRYLNYLTKQHSVSYLNSDADVWDIVNKKKTSSPEVPINEISSQLFTDPDESDTLSLSELDENDPDYAVKKDKIILRCSLKQRALASTLTTIPGLNPLEMVLAALVKPPSSLAQQSVKSRKRKRKAEGNEK